MEPVRVAIVGATSHVAKGLIAGWAERGDRRLFLYARAPERVREFLSPGSGVAAVADIDRFGSEAYDVVVNCVGMGTPQKLKESMAEIFRLTSGFDDLILGYLTRRPETLYVSLSSGAAYGSDFFEPVGESSQARFNLNSLKTEEYYGIAKLHAEARHRAMSGCNIVDLRIFGYFSRYIDLGERFLLSDILSCLRKKELLLTTPSDIWRDFLHPQDFVSLVDSCIARRSINAAYDAYSAAPASKFEILRFFAERYGLKYRVDESFQAVAATGAKSHYYPTGRKAAEIGFAPAFSSLAGIEAETAALVASWREGRTDGGGIA